MSCISCFFEIFCIGSVYYLFEYAYYLNIWIVRIIWKCIWTIWIHIWIRKSVFESTGSKRLTHQDNSSGCNSSVVNKRASTLYKHGTLYSFKIIFCILLVASISYFLLICGALISWSSMRLWGINEVVSNYLKYYLCVRIRKW